MLPMVSLGHNELNSDFAAQKGNIGAIKRGEGSHRVLPICYSGFSWIVFLFYNLEQIDLSAISEDLFYVCVGK